MKNEQENKALRNKFEDFAHPVDEDNWVAISGRLFHGEATGPLSDKFSTYETSPSQRVWMGIESTLYPTRKRRVLPFWWSAAGIAALIILGSLTFFYLRSPKKVLYTERPKTENKKVDNSQSSEGATRLNPSGNASANANSNFSGPSIEQPGEIGEVAPPASTSAERPIKEKPKLPESDFYISEDNIENTLSAAIIDSLGRQSASALKPIEAPNIDIVRNGELMANIHEEELKSDEEKKLKETPFYDGEEPINTNGFSLWAGSQLAFAASPNSDYESADYGSGFLNSNDETLGENADHKTPIYYGVNGELSLERRLQGGLGIGYLSLQSSQVFSSSNERLELEVASNYLSLPVYLKFNYIQKPKFTAYTSLGHSFDFMLSQKVNRDVYNGSQLISNTERQSREKGNQASVYFSGGVSYSFLNNFGVFAEGSAIHYYYLSYPNVFSQQKIWPGFRFGLLVNFKR